jgi:hypothetical protein
MPFGLKNVPPMYQWAISRLLRLFWNIHEIVLGEFNMSND